MSFKTFLIILLMLSAAVAAVLYGFQFMELLSPYADLSWISLSFFVVFSAAVYKIGQKTAKSENKQLFGQFFLMATGLKMFISLSIILLYFVFVKPASQYFIIPFFFVYLCFTVFEVYFMTRLGNNK